MDKRRLHCVTCATVTVFEVPPCTDVEAHEDCPERVCTRCGTAILFAPMTVVRAMLHPLGRIAPHQRRAA